MINTYQIDENYPLVSVTIPCFNAVSTISETLNSILAQTYKNIEIIVVNDGSTDSTLEVLRQYSSCVKVINQNNKGLAASRNVACRAANGKYIALLDADDLCLPGRIALQVAYMEQNQDIVMCSSDFSAFDKNGVIADSYIGNYYSRVAETGGVAGLYPFRRTLFLDGYDIMTYSGNVYDKMALGSFIHPPTVLFRKSVLAKCGLVDEAIVNCCDYDWFVRMSRVGEIGYIACPLLNYRISDLQMSGHRNRMQIAQDIVRVMEKTIASDPALFERHRPLFRRYLGEGYLGIANALVDNSRPFHAMVALFRSITLGVVHLQSVKVVLKAVTPLWMLKRRLRRLISPKVV